MNRQTQTRQWSRTRVRAGALLRFGRSCPLSLSLVRLLLIMRVRPMVESDIPEVAEVHASSWRKAYRGILSDALLDDFGGTRLEKVWEGVVKRKNRLNLIAETERRVVGFIAFQERAEEADKSGEIIG